MSLHATTLPDGNQTVTFEESMIMKKIFKNIAIMLATSLALAGCSDEWDDHYNGPLNADGNLWEAIKANPDLSNFASVVKAVGYDRALASSQMFTVFAPVNDNFSAERAQELISAYTSEKAKGVRDKDNSTIKEFVQNHIALYNYSVASTSSDSIVMLNGKYKLLTGSSFGGDELVKANQVYGNGVLYTLSKPASYVPNIFEGLKKVAGLDSVANFLYAYNVYKFDPSKSVAGDIVDGKTIYLDSVSTLENEMLDNLGYLDAEDSTYWMLAPTNEVWNRLVPKYEKYFHFSNGVFSSDPHLRDSLTWTYARQGLIIGSVFNRSLNSRNTDVSFQDSAYATTAYNPLYREAIYGDARERYCIFDKPFGPEGIFHGASRLACSNGMLLGQSDWRIKARETFMKNYYIEGERSSNIDSVDNQSTVYPLEVTKVSTDNVFYNQVHRHAFSTLAPSGTSSNPMVYFNLSDVLSNVPYDIYVITAPALAGDSLASDMQRLPTVFRARIAQCDKSGKISSNPSTWETLGSKYTTTADKVDTFLVAKDYKFDYCGYTQKATAQLIIDTRVSNTQIRGGKYNRYLRIDAIVLKPHEEE